MTAGVMIVWTLRKRCSEEALRNLERIFGDLVCRQTVARTGIVAGAIVLRKKRRCR